MSEHYRDPESRRAADDEHLATIRTVRLNENDYQRQVDELQRKEAAERRIRNKLLSCGCCGRQELRIARIDGRRFIQCANCASGFGDRPDLMARIADPDPAAASEASDRSPAFDVPAGSPIPP